MINRFRTQTDMARSRKGIDDVATKQVNIQKRLFDLLVLLALSYRKAGKGISLQDKV
ncbi:MAG: hypothetical protein J6C87_07360 [Bacteroides sp.]|nr:hypothetical protein [Bacteroides sp.]